MTPHINLNEYQQHIYMKYENFDGVSPTRYKMRGLISYFGGAIGGCSKEAYGTKNSSV